MSTPEKSEARERAEARRQKILGSRGNRLAKLTNTARGEEGSAIYDHDAPLAGFASPAQARSEFMGETSTPPFSAPSAADLRSNGDMPLGEWPQGANASDFMNQAFMNALGGGGVSGRAASGDELPTPADPLMAMMQSMATASQTGAPQPQQGQTFLKQQSRTSRLLPLIHAVSILLVLLYAIAVAEPRAWEDSRSGWRLDAEGQRDGWERWSSLMSRGATGMGVQATPVFYAFLTLQLVLHSLHLVLDLHASPPPGLISTVLPYLPPSLRLYITSGMKYISLGQQFLDDLALIIFVLGVIIWRANLAIS